MLHRIVSLGVLLLVVVSAPAPAKEFVAEPADFSCMMQGATVPGHKVRIFHHKKRLLRKAIRVLEREKPKKKYPVGTILQLVPFEAMVKRGGRFNKDGNGWEFFALRPTATGTEIVARGAADVVNQFNGTSCQGCHVASRDFDFVCDVDHGCGLLGVPDAVILRLQEIDPRCP